jgi:hypothetical protein
VENSESCLAAYRDFLDRSGTKWTTDAGDYAIWRAKFGTSSTPPAASGNVFLDGSADATEFADRRDQPGKAVGQLHAADESGHGNAGTNAFSDWKANVEAAIVRFATTPPSLEFRNQLVPSTTELQYEASKTAAVDLQAARIAVLENSFHWRGAKLQSRGRIERLAVIEPEGNELMRLLASDRVRRSEQQSTSAIDKQGSYDRCADDLECECVLVEPLSLDIAVWQ